MKNIVSFLIILLIGHHSLKSQCLTSRHNTSLNDGWVSCSTSPNPNSIRGTGHWIMYDLDAQYHIEDLQFWNYNHPDHLNRGARDIMIDISNDGNNWTEATSYTLSQASGSSSYIGELGPIIDQSAQYVLITIINTYGDTCAALSEIRIGVADEINCQNNYSLTGDLGRRKYHAQDFIETNGLTSVSDLVQLQAQNSISLQAGFQTLKDVELEILLGPCDD